MKNYLVIALLFFTTLSFGQQPAQVTNLAKIAKVWGFLKYYHPAVAKGQINWDAELFRLLPMSAKSNKDFDLAIEEWYRSLPEARLSPIATQPKGDSVVVTFNERDIQKINLNATFTASLTSLYVYHIPDSSNYITNTYKQYTLDFLLNKEAEFNENSFPDQNLRMLALFRYWNIINYQYPHKKQLRQNWDKTLTKFIPLFWRAENKTAYRRAGQLLTAEMNDSHSSYQEQDYTDNQAFNVAFELVKIGHRYYVNGIYNADIATSEGVKIGDEIVAVNGLSVRDYERNKLAVISGSNEGSKSRDQARQLLRIDTAKTLALLVGREGEKFLLKVKRYKWEVLNKRSSNQAKSVKPVNWKQVENGVWYVKFCSVTTAEELKEMFTAIKSANKVIWDMRGYPVYGLLPQAFAPLMPQTTDLGSNAIANLFFPGSFTLKKEIYLPEVSKFDRYDGSMIVLVNEQTQSLAESVSAQLSLRPKTIIMGSQTAGTTGNVNYFNLPGGIKISFTAVGVYGKASSFVQGKGVKIDVKVLRSKTAMNTKADFLLQRAISHPVNVR